MKLADGEPGMTMLGGFRVVRIGVGLAAAVCGSLFAEVGAPVSCIGWDNSTPLAAYLNHGKTTDPEVSRDALTTADLIVCEGRPHELRDRQCDALSLRRRNPRAA